MLLIVRQLTRNYDGGMLYLHINTILNDRLFHVFDVSQNNMRTSTEQTAMRAALALNSKVRMMWDDPLFFRALADEPATMMTHLASVSFHC